MNHVPQPRDLRFDLLRGIALLIVFVDHIPGNSLARWTPGRLGLSDMAELFVFISGYVCGLTYGRTLRSCGLSACQKKAVLRAGQIALTNVAMITAVLTVLAFYGIAPPGYRSAHVLSVDILRRDPLAMFPEVLFLSIQTTHFAILPLYVVLLLGLPLVLCGLIKRPVLTLAGLTVIYVLAQTWPRIWSVPEPWKTAWYFEPIAWQILFYGGAAAAVLCRPQPYAAPPPLMILLPSLVLIEAAFLWRILEPDQALAWSDKNTLAPLRLLHFLCLVAVGRWLLRPDAAWFQARILRPLILCGRNSLLVYCLGGVLAIVATLMLRSSRDRPLLEAAVNVSGLILLCVAAWLWSLIRPARGVQRPESNRLTHPNQT